MCGNHCSMSRIILTRLGSPPRVREPPIARGLCIALPRITPACAGTTADTATATKVWRDHPRVCGNHFLCMMVVKHLLGSPPRVREPLLCVKWNKQCNGITPACAGTTAHRKERS